MQQATPISYPAPLEPRWVTRCDRSDVDCVCVSTVIDSPSKVPAIAAAPIWFDARLRSHSNGLIVAGLAGRVWGFENSPHALAVQFHQYTFAFIVVSTYIVPETSKLMARCDCLVSTETGQVGKPKFARRAQSFQWERMTRALLPIKNRTSGCVSVDRSTWATLSTYNTPTQLDGHSRISRPRYVDAIQRRTL